MQLTSHEVRILHGLAASTRALCYRHALDILLGDPSTDGELTRLEQFGYITASPDDGRQTLVLTSKGWDHITKDPSDQFVKVGVIHTAAATIDQAMIQWEPNQKVPEGTELYIRVSKGVPGQTMRPVLVKQPTVDLIEMPLTTPFTPGFGAIAFTQQEPVTIDNVVYVNAEAFFVRSLVLNPGEDIHILSEWMKALAERFVAQGYLTKSNGKDGRYIVSMTDRGVKAFKDIKPV